MQIFLRSIAFLIFLSHFHVFLLGFALTSNFSKNCLNNLLTQFKEPIIAIKILKFKTFNFQFIDLGNLSFLLEFHYHMSFCQKKTLLLDPQHF